MASVYIETTIPSFYYTERTGLQMMAWREQTRRWWTQCRDRYAVFTSLAVVRELRASPAALRDRALKLLAGIEQLDINDRVISVAEHYLEHKLMPRVAEADAIHVAVASVHSIDFLLTWNCKHLANANKARHLEAINRKLGLSVPLMVTPYNLVGEEPA